MIKSKSSLENKIPVLSDSKTDKNKIENQLKISSKKEINKNEEKNDGNEESKLEKSFSQKDHIFKIKKVSSNVQDNKLKTIYSNDTIKKERENKKFQKKRKKVVQLKIYSPNQTSDNLLITDRILKNNEDKEYKINVVTPQKTLKGNYKGILNQIKTNEIRTPKKTISFMKDFRSNHNKNLIHRNRKLKSNDLRYYYTEKNSDIYLNTQNNEYNWMKKYSGEPNYIIKEIDEPSFANETEMNDSFYNIAKTQRGKSCNNSFLKDINGKGLNNYYSQKNSLSNLKQNPTFFGESKKSDFLSNHTLYNSSQKNLFFLRKKNLYQMNTLTLNSYNTLTKTKTKQNCNNLNRTFYSSKPKSMIKNISLNSTFCETQNNLYKNNYYKKKTSVYSDKKPKNKSLAPILENQHYHYLEGTVCTKNKIVKKPKNTVDDYPTLRNIYKLIEKNEIKGRDFCKPLDKNRKIMHNYNMSPTKKSNAKTKMNNISVKANYIKKNNNSNFNSNQRDQNKSKKYRLKNRASSMDNSLVNLTTLSNTHLFNGKIEDYLITKELGKGSYAVVKLAMHKITREKFAIKIYKKESLLDPQKRNTVKNEINILKHLNHINIMKLYEVIDSSKYLYLVLEYIKGISLLDVIKNEKNHYIEQSKAIKLFLQVVKGISYLQSKNINHRDIKLENILVKEDDIIKIIDFGFAVKSGKDSYQKLFCGTPSYMSPEIVNKEKYIAQYSDVWSLGVLLYAMLFGKFPFRAKDDETLFMLINKGEFDFPEYISVDKKIKIMIKKILNIEPKLRPSPEEIINDIIMYE